MSLTLIATWAAVCVLMSRIHRRLQAKGYRGPVPPVLAWVITLGAVFAAVWWWFQTAAEAGDPHPVGWRFALLVCTVHAALLAVAALVVRVLPVSRRRPAGQRAPRLPFRLIGTLVVVLTTAAVGYLLATDPEHSRPAYGAAIIGFALAYRCFAAVQRVAQEPPGPVRPGSSVVLYMRGFAHESTRFTTYTGYQEVSAGRVLDALNPTAREHVTFERFLEPTARARLGEWRGLGNPTDYLPPVGARREYVDDQRWREAFTALVRPARCVLTHTAPWPNLPYELGVIRDEGAAERLFVLTPPRRRGPVLRLLVWARGQGPVGWDEFVAVARRPDKRLGRAGFEFGADPGSGAVVTFDARGRALVLARGAATPQEYLDPIRTHLERVERRLRHAAEVAGHERAAEGGPERGGATPA
ncbi:hypothetical protein [Actinokineospora sp. NBRC 105648]|uniref:hypothetical protein n=1 Tax=Actinokineospora sp. NBRC 105648 TaxID=3032206 RepID=UPI0025544398|nr:hypothetical protein [Actinokineospora sp. NBRC 105648]